MEKYYGELKVIEMDGNNIKLEDGTTIVLTNKQLNYLVTDEPKDLTQIRDLMLDNIMPELFDIIEQHNIRKGDFQTILQSFVGGFNESFNQAIGKAFGTYKEGVHSEYFLDNIRVSDIKKFKTI